MNLITVFVLCSALQAFAINQSELPITYPFVHLQNTSSENPNHHERMFDRLGMGIHNHSNNNIDYTSDYVRAQGPDGKTVFMLKDYLPGYKASFDMSMLRTTSAVSWAKRKISSDYNNSSYFASKFDRYSPTRVFHCIGNYRYKGFRDYVKKLPGFEDFLLNICDQLKPGNALHKELTKSGNLQDFAVLKNMYQEKLRKLEKKAQAKHQDNLRKILSAENFSEHGIRLLEHHNIADQFLYTGSLEQITQLKQITNFMNDIGEFRHEYHKTPELNEISDSATGFGVLANNANRENLPGTSQAFLEIGQNLLALGRGLVAGCGRNVSGIYHIVRHPINTGTEIAGLIKNIGIGIGNVAKMLAKNEVGHRLNDPKLIDSAQQDTNRYVDSARQIYEYAKKTWQDKSTIERYELVGNIAANLLLAKGLPVAGKLVPIKNLAQYKPQAFAKLGNVGREINQIAGLTCVKGAKAVKRGFEVAKNYPHIIQGQQLLGEAVWYGNKCLNASNKYLRKVSNQYLKSLLDPERLVMRLGNKIKKLPKNCLSKTKEWLNDEAIVVDTLGNRWSSKMGSDEWLVNLSDKGKQSLTLLNEAVESGAETISISKKLSIEL